tara:strand:+ start:2393 stop:2716 length:324 start_codon:yes stop_codon:yes gene_type:complete
MNNFEKKEKNLNNLLEKLGSIASSYSQSSSESEKLEIEKNQLFLEKKRIEKKNQELLREHHYLKSKILKLQQDMIKKSEFEEKFNQDIDELSKETENLVDEIDKWQM